MGAGGLEQVEGAVGVDTEVGLRVAGGPVVGGLGGGVDDQLDLAGVLAEDPVDGVAVADVGVLPAELGVLGDEPLGHVRGRGLRPEEAGPHVVLDPDDVEALADEVLDRLGADQPPGPRDDRNRHSRLLPSPAGVSMLSARPEISRRIRLAKVSVSPHDRRRLLGNVAKVRPDSAPNEIEGSWNLVVGRNRAHQRPQVGGEIGVAQLGSEVVDKLRIAVDAASHVMTESRGDLCVVQSRSIEADPEIEQIATLAALAERPDLGGENVLNREGSHRRVSAPPRRLHGVGNEDVATVWLTLLDVGLDLHPDRRLPRLRGGVKPDVRDIGVLARLWRQVPPRNANSLDSSRSLAISTNRRERIKSCSIWSSDGQGARRLHAINEALGITRYPPQPRH